MGDQIGKMGWTGHVARMGDRGGKYTVLVVRPERKRPIGGSSEYVKIFFFII